MALTRDSLEILKPILKNRTVLSLGYPDIVLTPGEVKDLLGVEVTTTTQHGKRHGADKPLAETQEVFKKLGCELTCVDIVQDRGCEIVRDLNYPQDFGEFDLVLDPGTIEHCFNIGQAILNAANSVKVGGFIFHSPPLSMVNHGFYNISPTLLHDFYAQNGWVIKHMSVRNKDGLQQFHPTGRFKAPPECSVFMVAKKIIHSYRFPIQTKYAAILQSRNA